MLHSYNKHCLNHSDRQAIVEPSLHHNEFHHESPGRSTSSSYFCHHSRPSQALQPGPSTSPTPGTAPGHPQTSAPLRSPRRHGPNGRDRRTRRRGTSSPRRRRFPRGFRRHFPREVLGFIHHEPMDEPVDEPVDLVNSEHLYGYEVFPVFDGFPRDFGHVPRFFQEFSTVFRGISDIFRCFPRD